MNKKFNNPVWSALNETHQHLAINYKGMKFYNPEICPFGAFTELDKSKNAINEYSRLTENFFVVGEKPFFNNPITLTREVICNQMILETLNEPKYNDTIIKLTPNHINEVYDLVWLVMPGYYKKLTFTMGNYYGIFKNNKLVALTGERLQSNTFIEVSAVVTHPEYTGNGYAKQLVAHTSKHILEQNKTAILHVAEDNINAIRLYEKLGYVSHHKITWRNFDSK